MQMHHTAPQPLLAARRRLAGRLYPRCLVAGLPILAIVLLQCHAGNCARVYAVHCYCCSVRVGAGHVVAAYAAGLAEQVACCVGAKLHGKWFETAAAAVAARASDGLVAADAAGSAE